MPFCFLPGGADVCQTAGVLRWSDQRALPAGIRAAHSGIPARGGVSEESAAHAGVTSWPERPETNLSMDAHFPPKFHAVSHLQKRLPDPAGRRRRDGAVTICHRRPSTSNRLVNSKLKAVRQKGMNCNTEQLIDIQYKYAFQTLKYCPW